MKGLRGLLGSIEVNTVIKLEHTDFDYLDTLFSAFFPETSWILR